jgi:hypothetical protein
MERKIRMLFSVTVLAGIIGWIVLSYLPASVVTLPQFEWSASGLVRFFPGLILAGFVIFFGLQLWLTWSTGVAVRQYNAESDGSQTFTLSAPREVFLTALPIGFTVIVAFASYAWWQRLAVLP